MPANDPAVISNETLNWKPMQWSEWSLWSQQRSCLFSLFLKCSLIVFSLGPCIFLRVIYCSTSQIMVNVMHARPRYDFSADYFVKIYRAECVNLRLHCNLIKSILDKQVCTNFMCKLWNAVGQALSSELSVTRIAQFATKDTTVQHIHF